MRPLGLAGRAHVVALAHRALEPRARDRLLALPARSRKRTRPSRTATQTNVRAVDVGVHRVLWRLACTNLRANKAAIRRDAEGECGSQRHLAQVGGRIEDLEFGQHARQIRALRQRPVMYAQSRSHYHPWTAGGTKLTGAAAQRCASGRGGPCPRCSSRTLRTDSPPASGTQ